MKTPEGFDSVYLCSGPALDGHWNAVRLMLETTISHLEETRPFCAGTSNYFATVLPDVGQVTSSPWVSDALECIHREESMPHDVTEPLLDLLHRVLNGMDRTAEHAAVASEQEVIKAPIDLLEPPAEPLRHLGTKIEWNLAKAFRLRVRPPSRPGRYVPKSVGREYDRIQTFGTGRVVAVEILAHRFRCPWRRIYRLLEGREMMFRDAEWNPQIGTKETLSSEVLRGRRFPFAPYFHSKLTVAVERRIGNRRPANDDFEGVAADFALSVPGEFYGRELVKNAYDVCKKAETGWARFALAVARAEPRTVVPFWPWDPANPPKYHQMPFLGPDKKDKKDKKVENVDFSDLVIPLTREAPSDSGFSYHFSASPQSTALSTVAEALSLKTEEVRGACHWKEYAELLSNRLPAAA